MKSRAQRLLSIKKVIVETVISSQDELLRRLLDEGFEVTQATLSRDLRALKVMKVSDDEHGYIYKMPEHENAVPATVTMDLAHVNFLADGFIGVEFSGNLGVIKTIPGYASSIAAVIDGARLFEVIGTVAGDDTILLIVREGIGRSDVINALISTMPKLEGKIK